MSDQSRILVVDDDPILLSMITRILQEAGYEVVTAGTGEEAMRLAQATNPDLMLLDVVLPDVDGVEVCRRVKETDVPGRPHIILLSGIKTESDAQALGLESGADGYIVRPIANRELLARVEAMLRLRKAEAALVARTQRLEEEIAQRKQVEEALRQSEARRVQDARLAAVGQLAAGLAHTFNNIFVVLMLRAELALRQAELHPELRQSLTTICEQTAEASRLVEQLLDFTGKAVIRPTRLDLAHLLRKQLSELRPMLPPALEVAVRVHENEEYEIEGDAARLGEMIGNLVQNAQDAMPTGGRLTFSLRRGVAGAVCVVCQEPVAGEWIELAAADSGEGIAKEVLPRIFEPFFSTRVPERTGLGLSQVLGIVKQHDGHISVTSETDDGTTVSVYLPPAIAGP